MSLKMHIKSMFFWVVSWPKIIIELMFDRFFKNKNNFLGRKRFLSLTPRNIENQIVYDRYNCKLINLYVRDDVDIEVMKQVFMNHDYGFFKLKRMDELINVYNNINLQGRVPLIIDCGSNNGMSMRYFSETFNRSHVVGIEPDINNFTIAKKNTCKNKTSLHNAAIGCKKTKGSINNKNSMHWAYMIKEIDDGDLEVITINDLLKDHDVNTYNPFILKIDIEGYEDNLFSSNVEWIDLFPVIIIELHDWMMPRKANSNNFLREISLRNRDFIFFGENVFSISNTF